MAMETQTNNKYLQARTQAVIDEKFPEPLAPIEQPNTATTLKATPPTKWPCLLIPAQVEEFL